MSIPVSRRTSTASGLSLPGSSPALVASKNSPHRLLSNAAAIWLRALLWTQMKRTFFFIWKLIRARQQAWFLFLVRNEIVDLALGDGDVHPNVGEIVKSDHIA